MTNEEAIKILEVAKAETEWTAPLDYHEAFDVAIEALEKQIPKKPFEGNVHIVYLCPNCHSLNYTTPYCRHCGQRIGWTEGET